MKKLAGLVLVMVGVGLAALYGARNPDVLVERSEAGGRAAMLGAQEQGAWAPICAWNAALEAEEACAGARAPLPASIGAAAKAGEVDLAVLRTRAWVRAQRAALTEDDVDAAYRAFLDTIPAARAVDGELAEAGEDAEPSAQQKAALQARREAWAAVCAASDEDIEHCASAMPTDALGAARPAGEDGKPAPPTVDWAALDADKKAALDAWFGAAGALQEARLNAATHTAPPPGARLGAWFGAAGVPFVIGIVLIVVGGLLARRAEKEAATADASDTGSTAKGPRDLGTALDTLAQRATELATDIGDTTKLEPARAESIKDELDILVTEHLEPIIESRGRVQARYGMAGFAAVFGPLSAGERKLNRAWSALVDAHPPEARSSLESAAASFEQARAELDSQAKAA